MVGGRERRRERERERVCYNRVYKRWMTNSCAKTNVNHLDGKYAAIILMVKYSKTIYRVSLKYNYVIIIYIYIISSVNVLFSIICCYN